MFPRDLNSITPEWLKSLQIADDVTELQVERIQDQGLTAEVAVIRFKLNVDKRKSLVAKVSSPDLATRSKFASYYAREVLFYRDIAPISDIKVPDCYFAECDGDDHLILLEDMNPALPGNTIAGVTEDFAFQFVELISGFHASWWNKPELTTMKSKFPQFGSSFGVGYSQALREHAGLISLFGGTSTHRLAQRLDSGLQRLWSSQWREPQTIVQWDSHASNVMRPPHGSSGWSVLDWQNCVVGSGAWDIARFCVLSLSIDIRRSFEKEIVGAYADALTQMGITTSFDSLWATYRRFMPLMFAQQFRFLSSSENGGAIRDAWKEAVMPRVVAALHDSF